LPAGVFPDRSSRRLDPKTRNGEGRALSIWGDAGWSERVRDGKYNLSHFDEHLVTGAAQLVWERWCPDPPPQWVTAVPSLRHPDLVSDFARRLAAALGLPYREALVKRHDTPEQKLMQNSAQQVTNVVDAIAAVRGRVLPGPVLLVDDIVDSGWTMTACGGRLRRAGSGVVYPFALAAMPPGKDPG
jgi:ATP-dependent DNA helicase RecQ